MRVTVFTCGAAVNESEVNAIEQLKRLQGMPGSDEWILLTNLAFAVTHQFQSDEIDIIAIGPPGVRVIEVKHWAAGWVDSHTDLVEQEADKVTNKARKIGTTLRRIVPSLPRVDGAILLTQPPSKIKRIAGRQVRGVTFYDLKEWKGVVGVGGPSVLTPPQVSALSRVLAPKSSVALDGSLRRLAGYVNLELQTPKEQRFHRVYKGSHPARRDRVALHLYDLSASDGKNAEVKAKREADALQRLQLYAWAPRILDSWQDAPGYAGEMFFFTVVDPAAPCIEDRSTDVSWNSQNRLLFARDAIRALNELHQEGLPDEPLVHRNLTPRTILVRHDNSPIFTGFDRAKIPSDISVASSGLPTSGSSLATSPEVQKHGLAAADQRSDVYSLCACLRGLLTDGRDEVGARAVEILAGGLAEQREQRRGLAELEVALSELLGDSVPAPPAPPARFWTEEQTVRFHSGDYRIVARLGSGGVGTTFKVLEVDRATGEELGTYVAKVAHEPETGQKVLKAYGLARSHLGRHEALSPIHEFAREWQENNFIALLGWIEGTPLNEFIGVFPLLAEDQGEQSGEALAIRWIRLLCDALRVLHSNGLIHGDISPRNMIVSGTGLVLTDYDFVSRIGEAAFAPGTISYCSPSRQRNGDATPADDLFALAASFFHVMFDQEPFRYGGEVAKDRGLNWDKADRGEYPAIAAVLDKATAVDPLQRFASATEMLQALVGKDRRLQNEVPNSLPGGAEPTVTSETGATTLDQPDARTPPQTELSEQHVDWLKSLLQSYPGSRWGNQETRGLDTDFATATYVQTPLEASLLDDIRTRRVRLVILCGNAGDGKTALLQHLAQELGLGHHSSANRVVEGSVSNGPTVRMNLDGSASWQGKSADVLLDQFLEPFHHGLPAQDIVHLLAVNDGRLLEWLEGVEERRRERTPLTEELYRLLQRDSPRPESHIRFISLNERSLVGGITSDRSRIDTEFLDGVIDQLYGGARASDIWSPCLSCSAKDRCRVFQAGQLFAPTGFPLLVEPDVRQHARQGLFEALQAVHLRGETHITVRELRAALVYVLFGIHFCDEYHEGTEEEPLPYWDRAFAADSAARQGEVLRELARFDPALEAHPQIDRYLLSRPAVDGPTSAPRYHGLPVESARRRAFFEWTRGAVEQVAGNSDVLDLARGRHLRRFRDLPLTRDSATLAELTKKLCEGISRLEDLPPQALDRDGVVPLRIAPRTPTETAFWVEKPLDAFRVEADLPDQVDGIERLHRQVLLVYEYRDGQKERLRMGAELFHLLLELADGYQLGDVSTDDTFSHLSIFVQRLVREDERELLAWSPTQDQQIYRISAVVSRSAEEAVQRIVLTRL